MMLFSQFYEKVVEIFYFFLQKKHTQISTTFFVWDVYPLYTLLDDRTIYLQNLYIHCHLKNLSESECLDYIDRILTSLIVRLRLPISDNPHLGFDTVTITNSELRNFANYSNTLILLASTIKSNEGMQRICSFFKATESCFYISNAETNSQSTTKVLFSLLNELAGDILKLQQREKFPQISHRYCHELPIISEEKISLYVDTAIHFIDLSICSSYNDTICEMIHHLAYSVII